MIPLVTDPNSGHCWNMRQKVVCSDQSLVAGARNNAKPDFACGRMIFWRQADTGRELTPRLEARRIRGLHRHEHCADRSDAWDLGETSAALIGPMPGGELGIDLVDLSLQLHIFLGANGEQLFSHDG
jgi:hypothetical protein